MKTAKKILKHYYNASKSKDYTKECILKAMEDYAEQQSTLIYNLFNKPSKELKPLEDLWRKENLRDSFTIPDTTAFYKWIRVKILNK